MIKIENKSLITPIAPVENTSPRASTSLVRRVINLPTGVLSKKFIPKERTWLNKSFLISAVICCPSFCTKKPCTDTNMSCIMMVSVNIIAKIFNP